MCIFRNKGITFNYVIVTFRLSKIKEINTFIMLIINSLYSNLASFPSNIHNYYYFPSLVFNPESHIVFSFHSSSTSSHSLASLFFMIFLKSSVQLFHRKSSIWFSLWLSSGYAILTGIPCSVSIDRVQVMSKKIIGFLTMTYQQ